MTEKFVDGGPFMWPILILFIIGIVISLYKLFSLLGTSKDAGKLMTDVKKSLATQGVEGALKLAERIRDEIKNFEFESGGEKIKITLEHIQ